MIITCELLSLAHSATLYSHVRSAVTSSTMFPYGQLCYCKIFHFQKYSLEHCTICIVSRDDQRCRLSPKYFSSKTTYTNLTYLRKREDHWITFMKLERYYASKYVFLKLLLLVRGYINLSNQISIKILVILSVTELTVIYQASQLFAKISKRFWLTE